MNNDNFNNSGITDEEMNEIIADVSNELANDEAGTQLWAEDDAAAFDGTELEPKEEKPHNGRLTLMLIIVFLALVAAAVLLLTLQGESKKNSLVINEVVSSNKRSVIDTVLGTPDWIELYNGSQADINLKGYKLATDKKSSVAYVFPDVTIRAGEYMLVYCAEDDNAAEGQLVSGFTLSKKGVEIKLVDADSIEADAVKVPALERDIAWGRDKNGSFMYMTPTPLKENADGVETASEVVAGDGSADFVITEVMPKNSSTLADEEGKYYEWVEIYNAGNTEADLEDWALSDDQTQTDKWRFPSHKLGAGEYVIVYLCNTAVKDGLYADFGLSDADSHVYLFTPQGESKDSVSWAVPVYSDVSVGKDSAGETVYYVKATPGADNDSDGIAKMEFIEQAGSAVVINEVLVKNAWSKRDEDGDRPAWVELYNASGEDIDLSRYALSDDETEIGKWRLPEQTLGGGEYVIVYLDGKNKSEGELHTSFTLSANDSVLTLTDYADFTIEKIALPEAKENVSYGKDKDGKWGYYAQPTPGSKNTTKSFAELASVPALDTESVYISEVSAAHEPKEKKGEWIELYNGSDGTVDLSGYYLSDSSNETTRYKISEGTQIAAGGHKVFYTDNMDSVSLSMSGEGVYLVSPQEGVLDRLETGALRAGASSGRVEGDASGVRVFFSQQTPGEKNADPLSGYAQEPVFSSQSGFYSSAFEVAISADEGAKVYYTTDGTKPTSSSTPYSAPISVNGTLVLRAVAYADGKLKSDVATANYLFDEAHTIPVVCISGNQSEINTVYQNTERKYKVEREVHITYIEPDGTLGVEFPAGIRVSGNSTRNYAQKSLNIYLRSGYGRSSVVYPFFKDYDYTQFSSLTLRNSGQDNASAKLRDAFASRIALGMNVDTAGTQFVALYINGKYWGLYDLKENQNEDYLETHYGVDDVEMIRRNEVALAGTKTDHLKMRAYARSKDFSSDEVLKNFSDMADVLGYTDYIIFQSYIMNTDMYNQKYWRSVNNKVRWKPILYDLDFAFRSGTQTRSMLSSWFMAGGVPSPEGTTSNMDVPCALKENKKWRDELIRRAAWYNKNTLSSERLLEIFDEMVAEMEPEISRQVSRWGSPSSWKSNVSAMRKVVSERDKYFMNGFKSYFGVSDQYINDLLAAGQDPFWGDIEEGRALIKDITKDPLTAE